MESRDAKRVELVLPIRTVLIVVAAIGLMAAFTAIGATFLIIFVGIFLALVFVAVTLFGALLGVLGALTAVPLAATIQIFIQELTKARREQVDAARAALGPPASAA